MTVWRMRIACCIPKATNTHSQYVISISFPLQQWLHEHPWILRYTYMACIVNNFIVLFMGLSEWPWNCCCTPPPYNSTISNLAFIRKVSVSIRRIKHHVLTVYQGVTSQRAGWMARRGGVVVWRREQYLAPYPESNLGSWFCQLVVQSLQKVGNPHLCVHSYQ